MGRSPLYEEISRAIVDDQWTLEFLGTLPAAAVASLGWWHWIQNRHEARSMSFVTWSQIDSAI
jgi:hypothetical protein